MPLTARLAAPLDANRPDDLVAKVEAHLRDHPQDGKGWDVIAPVYMAGGRYPDAADAFAKAMKLLGESPARLQGFADARIRSENGIVPDDARKALQSLVAAEPNLKEPRVWLALAKEQDGKLDEAAADYQALIAEAPAGAPWRGFLQERLDMLKGAKASAKEPDAASAAAVQSMSPEDRQAFITRMVDGLAERLKTNVKDKDGWMKLIRSYQMLGRKEDASKALANAKAGLAGDEAAVRDVDDLARQLGVGG
jgi:cytochrome c-type biogenesis protein CcmH